MAQPVPREINYGSFTRSLDRMTMGEQTTGQANTLQTSRTLSVIESRCSHATGPVAVHPFDQHEVRWLYQVVAIEEISHRRQRCLWCQNPYKPNRKAHY